MKHIYVIIVSLSLLSPSLRADCLSYDLPCLAYEKVAKPTYEEVLKPAGEFFKETIYEKGLRDVIYEQGLKPGAEGLVDAAKIGSSWVAARFRDTQATRAVDYGIRKAALESALAVATGVLKSTEGVAQGTLITARETANAALTTAEQFLDKIVENVSQGVLIGAAESAKGIIEGVKQGSVWTIKAGKIVLTEGPLNWFDINQMSYRGNFRELEDGVLGHVTLLGELFKKKIEINDISLDARKGYQAVVQVLEDSVIDPIVKLMINTIFAPIKNAVQETNELLTPTQRTIQQLQQIPEIGPLLKQAQQEVNDATKDVQSLDKAQDTASKTIEATLQKAQVSANEALEKAVSERETRSTQSTIISNKTKQDITLSNAPSLGTGATRGVVIHAQDQTPFYLNEGSTNEILIIKGSGAGNLELDNDYSAQKIRLISFSETIKNLNPTFTMMDWMGNSFQKKADDKNSLIIDRFEKISIKTPNSPWELQFRIADSSQ